MTIDKRFGVLLAWALLTALPACSLQIAKGSDPADRMITSAVESKLAQHAGLMINGMEVRTINHEVILTGFVDTVFESRLAEAEAASVPGVTRVFNELAVRGNRG